MAPMYCSIADVKNNVSGTDDGTGTCAQLADGPISAAIAQASNKVSAYAGTVYETDPATPTVTVPDLVVTLTIQLAVYYATLIYRKSKDLTAQDPVALMYADAMRTLMDINSGKISVDPVPPGDPVSTGGHVVQTVPRIFDYSDSGVEYDGRGGIEPVGAPGSLLRDGWQQ